MPVFLPTEDVVDALIGTVLGLVGFGVSVYFGVAQLRQDRERRSVDEFLESRRVLKTRYPALRAIAMASHRNWQPDGAVPIVAKPEWLLRDPLPLAGLGIEVDMVDYPPGHDALLRSARRYLPLTGAGRMSRYHEAVAAFDRPGNWFNGRSYRLLGVHVTGDPPAITLRVGSSWYWDGFDVTQSLAHEAAHLVRKRKGRKVGGPVRRQLADPFAVANRITPIGFTTLTIRRAGGDLTFYLHRRDERVAMGQNLTTVVPAGEFQPSDDSTAAFRSDADLWLTVMREYAEEFLGLDEARVRRGAPIDYLQESPYREMNAELGAGIRPFVVGMGIDPVNWKFHVYTVCVFESTVFDQIFSGMVAENSEGLFESPTRRRPDGSPLLGWPFDEPTVMQYLGVPDSASSLVPLMMAWRTRSAWAGDAFAS